jgi:enediyne biosynthesis protein E4
VDGAVTSAVATLTVLVPPSISRFQLSGQSATPLDSSHLYLSNSVSLGANINFTAIAGGTGPLHYQWQFRQIDLPGKTSTSLVITNVQSTNAGDYALVVTNLAGTTNWTATLTVDPTFTKITTGSVVTDGGYSPGGTWGDYNNDGFLDLFVYNGMDGVAYIPFLYRNNGNGAFTKVSSVAPVNFAAESYSAGWGDYDNDGNLDLCVHDALGRVLLYRNNGNSTFSPITNITTGTTYPNPCWVDYDNDGLLDIFVASFNGGNPSHSYLYRNQGNGTFARVTTNSIASDFAFTWGGAWGDYDNDGHVDLFVCGGTGSLNLVSTNRMYHNNGDGTFTKITTGSIVTDLGNSVSCAWGDYDNDGFLDLFVVNNADHKNFLYHNNGDGTFTRVTNSIVATDLGYNSLGCAWGDYDNDGWLDLYVGNEGDPGLIPTVVNFLYHNNGDGTFSKVTTGSPVNEYSDSWGVTWADYDNDGFLDLFASRGEGRGNYLYHNNGNSNNWLTVKLVGTVSNRSAIGAKVRVRATIARVSRWQLRQITGGSGFAGHNELRANFGLGDATNVETLSIEWPSGVVQTLTNVPAKQILTVVEHQLGATNAPILTSASRPADGSLTLTASGMMGLLYLFEGSTNLVNWTWLGVRSNATGSIQFTDLRATNYPIRFYRASIP